MVLPATLRPHNPLSDSSSGQSQIPTLVEILKRLLCVSFQEERTPPHTTADVAAPFSSSFSAPNGPFTPRPASRSESTDEDIIRFLNHQHQRAMLILQLDLNKKWIHLLEPQIA